MNNLSCFGHCDLDNPQCIKCKDKDCEIINNIFMETNFFEKHDKEIYNKAIDDMVQIIKDMRETAAAMMWIDREEACDKFIKQAEQLKAGGNNGMV